jgi:hypothetical protein
MEERKFLTRRQASQYISTRYFPCAAATLARLAVTGGGPIFRKAGTLMVIYEAHRLDEWARQRISDEFQTSTSVGRNLTGKPLGRPRKAPRGEASQPAEAS